MTFVWRILMLPSAEGEAIIARDAVPACEEKSMKSSESGNRRTARCVSSFIAGEMRARAW